MKFTRFSIFASAMLALTMASSFASDLTVRRKPGEPPVTTAYNWSGVYVGVNFLAGIGASGADSSPASALVPNSPAERMKGWGGGGQIGVLLQNGRIVYGLEADIDWTNISNNSTSSNTVRRTFFGTQLADTNTSQNNGAKVNYLSMVRANLGLAWDRVLWQITAGLAFGDVTWSNNQNVSTTTLSPTGVAFCNAAVISCPNGSAGASDSKTMWGYTAGTVFNVALNQSWRWKTEVDYVNLGRAGGATGSQRVDMYVAKTGFNLAIAP